MTTLNADRRLPLYKYHGRTAQDWFDSYRHEMIEAIEIVHPGLAAGAARARADAM